MHKRIMIAGLVAILFFTGCAESEVVIYDTIATAPQIVQPSPQTKTVGIYMDVTPSMSGFLCDRRDVSSPNYYIICLDELQHMMISNYGIENICFYRVDTSVWETGENVLEEALDSEYYDSSNKLAKSRGYKNVSEGTNYSFPCLTAALEVGQKEDFSILITDLYENKSENTNLLINKFGELAGKDDGKVFGCVAIRAPFAGVVYDIGAYGQSAEYGLDSDKFRPFYIVVRGYPDTVSNFCSSMGQRLDVPSTNLVSSVFYIPAYQGLDFRNFNTCECYDKKVIWIDKNKTVEINGSNSVYVYEYRGKADVLSNELLFSYLVPDEYREKVSAYAQQIGDIEPALNEGEEYQLIHLPVQVKDKQIARLSSNGESFDTADNSRATFVISSLSYDINQGVLHVGLQIQNFQSGIWRLQWKNIAEEEKSFWWDEWGSHSGSQDFSKTERLSDLIGSIRKNTSQNEFCLLNGTIYLSVKR